VSSEGTSASREKVERRAKELVDGGRETTPPIAENPETGRRAADRLLAESEARTLDPAARDPEDDSVIRRSSEETARP
jgi:hypothetical protein